MGGQARFTISMMPFPSRVRSCFPRPFFPPFFSSFLRVLSILIYLFVFPCKYSVAPKGGAKKPRLKQGRREQAQGTKAPGRLLGKTCLRNLKLLRPPFVFLCYFFGLLVPFPPGVQCPRVGQYRRGTTTPPACRFLPRHLFCLSIFSSLYLFIFPFVARCPCDFLLGTLGGYGGDDVGMDTAGKGAAVASRGQTTGSNAPNPLAAAFGTPVWVLPRRPLGGVICFRCRVFASFIIELRFGIGYGCNDGGMSTPAVSRAHHLFETMVGAHCVRDDGGFTVTLVGCVSFGYG